MHHSALQASWSNPKLAPHEQHHRCSTRSSSISSIMCPATTLRLCRDTSVREIVCLPFFSRQLPMRSETSSSCAAFASRIFLRDLHMDMRAHVAASSGTLLYQLSTRRELGGDTHFLAKTVRSPCCSSRLSTDMMLTVGSSFTLRGSFILKVV